MKNLYLFTLIALSFGMGAIEVMVNFKDEVVSDSTQTLWGLVFIVLSILWAYYDADSQEFEKPFSFGFQVYVFWPVAFPWYLISTRGVEGLIIFFGFISLWFGPWVAGLITYVYFAESS